MNYKAALVMISLFALALWSALAPLPGLGGAFAVGTRLNNARDVVGAAALSSGDVHAVMWQKSAVARDLGTLGGKSSTAFGINDRGQVVGISETSTGEIHAFLWDQGMTDLGTLSGVISAAFAINEKGAAVGLAENGSAVHACVWEGG